MTFPLLNKKNKITYHMYVHSKCDRIYCSIHSLQCYIFQLIIPIETGRYLNVNLIWLIFKLWLSKRYGTLTNRSSFKLKHMDQNIGRHYGFTFRIIIQFIANTLILKLTKKSSFCIITRLNYVKTSVNFVNMTLTYVITSFNL